MFKVRTYIFTEYEKNVQFIEVIILLTSMTKIKDSINLNEEKLSKNIDF